MIDTFDTSVAEEVALDTLSVLYLSPNHTAQFYIMESTTSSLYNNFLYVAEPVGDTDKVIGAGIISVSTQYNHALIHLLFPVGVALIVPLFLFPQE